MHLYKPRSFLVSPSLPPVCNSTAFVILMYFPTAEQGMKVTVQWALNTHTNLLSLVIYHTGYANLFDSKLLKAKNLRFTRRVTNLYTGKQLLANNDKDTTGLLGLFISSSDLVLSTEGRGWLMCLIIVKKTKQQKKNNSSITPKIMLSSFSMNQRYHSLLITDSHSSMFLVYNELHMQSSMTKERVQWQELKLCLLIFSVI